MEQNDPQVHEFLKSIALANTLKECKGEFLGSHYELALVETACSFGYTVRKTLEDRSVYLKYRDKTSRFKEICSTNCEFEKGRSRIILEEYGVCGGVLYVKGTPEAMLKVLQISSGEKHELIVRIAELTAKKLKCIIIAKRYLDAEEIDTCLLKMSNIRYIIINTRGRIDRIFKGLEKEVTLCGIVGFSETLLPNTKETMHKLQEAGIKLCMTSSDSQVNSYNTAVEAGFLSTSSHLIELTKVRNQSSCCQILLKGIQQFIYDKPMQLEVEKDDYNRPKRNYSKIHLLKNSPSE